MGCQTGPPYKGLIMTAKRLSERIQMRAEFAGVASNIVAIKDIHRQHFVLSFFLSLIKITSYHFQDKKLYSLPERKCFLVSDNLLILFDTV